LVGPDNGVLSIAWEALGGVEQAVAIESEDVLLTPLSRTFHGRDVFAPAAAHLAAGMPLGDLGSALDPATLYRVELPGPMVAPGALGTRVTTVDGYGNAQLNARASDLSAAGIDGGTVRLNGRVVPRAAAFSELDRQGTGLIVDSQGYLSVVVNHGSAASSLGLAAGDAVVIERL
jgi:S-adenosylmethionine hydrolase